MHVLLEVIYEDVEQSMQIYIVAWNIWLMIDSHKK